MRCQAVESTRGRFVAERHKNAYPSSATATPATAQSRKQQAFRGQLSAPDAVEERKGGREAGIGKQVDRARKQQFVSLHWITRTRMTATKLRERRFQSRVTRPAAKS